MCRFWKNIFKLNLFIFIWIKYEKANNAKSWVFLYVTKDDVRQCCKFIPYHLSTNSTLEIIQLGEKVLFYTQYMH
jgi:hypothetical protein